MLRAWAPGRVNLIGDHTDYTGGLVLPMAVQLGTEVVGTQGGRDVRLTSPDADGDAVVPLTVSDPASVTPPWARYVAGVVSVLAPRAGFAGRVSTTLPVGAGLSSSASLEVAVALALGYSGSPLELALACQQAEQISTGLPSGIMDQLAVTSGVEGHALLIDCHSLTVTPVRMPADAEVVVIHSGESRELVGSAYAERRRQCEAAEAVVGPLRLATQSDTGVLVDPLIRMRARHVVSENERVRGFADALNEGDFEACGALMFESHASLRDDFEVSTPRLDALVEALGATDGVYGARLTGAGFGGCVVALTRPGTVDQGWRVRAVAGARLLD